MKYRKLGNTGYEVSAIAYGGIVSSKHVDDAVIPGDGQMKSDYYVSWALDQGINYFDIAPGYGDAQLLMGNSIKDHRKNIYLACKTKYRDRKRAEQDLQESLKLLHTDYFDVYQMHAIDSMEQLEQAFAPGGVMELLREMKEKGIARKVGLTVHCEEAAVKALEWYDFDTVMFPVNWHMNLAHGMGNRICKAADEKGVGLLGIKSMIECGWDDETRYNSIYPKSWCRPFYLDKDTEVLIAAIKYSLSLGPDVLIPPGNFEHFRFGVEHIDDILKHPFSDDDMELLKARLPLVEDKPFFDSSCYA